MDPERHLLRVGCGVVRVDSVVFEGEEGVDKHFLPFDWLAVRPPSRCSGRVLRLYVVII